MSISKKLVSDRNGFVSHVFLTGAILFSAGASAILIGLPWTEKDSFPHWVGWGMIASGLGFWAGTAGFLLVSAASLGGNEKATHYLSRGSSLLLWLSSLGFAAFLLAGFLL